MLMTLSRRLKPAILAAILPLGASAAPVGGAATGLTAGDAPGLAMRVSSQGEMQYGACFYSRYDYQGSKMCYAPAELKRLPAGLDRHFRSIRLIGDVRVSLCSRTNLHGKCEGYDRSVQRLPRAVANKTYSLRIYRPMGGYEHGDTGNYGGGNHGGGGNGYGN